jgi:hypothetical protein
MREGGARPLLIGEGSLDDKAVGEKVEVKLDEVPGVRGRLVQTATNRYRIDLSNDRAVPVAVEVTLDHDDDERIAPNRALSRRDGKTLWIATVPANGRAQLRYRLED